LSVQSQDEQARIFFEGGQIVHANLGSRVGEEVIYELLTWEDGAFELEMDVSPPEKTITMSWSSLLLEGMRRIDERVAGQEKLDKLKEKEPKEEHKETNKMAKRRSDVLKEHLETLLAESSDVNGAAIVGYDGLVLASNLPVGGHDATRVGAEGAALLGLSRRTLGNLKCGNFEAAVLQGEDGWIITMGAGTKAIVLGLTEADVNLGMALLEMRDIAADVAGVMG
jgi:predicted regulator of Ras-like GTPase activity (Roadblock/LC7/MglB family)